MNSKILNLSKKVIAISIIVLLCSSSAVHAFSFGNATTNFGSFSSILSKIFKLNSYDLGDLSTDLDKLKTSENIDFSKISELISKLPSGDDKDILEYITKMFSISSEGNSGIDISSLLDTLMNAIQSLLGSSGSELPVEATSININAKTAVEFAGNDYAANLHANVYKHIDANGNEDSDKWVLLIHPFMLKGQTIANAIGSFYYEKGYNILAPDLRGFGDSDGSVALGFLESLDIYDWLNELNNNYDVEEVFVHGISLGGATTNFLSGIDEFIANGPTKVNTEIKSLRELKVVGLVEDCGYTNMEDFAGKSMLINMGIGLTDDNFDYYSDATNSLKYCDLPMLIIHGTSDTMVDPENADTVKNTTKGETEQWLVDGAAHAFIIMGSNSDEYKSHVQNFIDKYESTNVSYQPSETEPEKEITQEKQETQETESFLNKIINTFKSLYK